MNKYPHMCRMDHEEVGHWLPDERCPVCLMRDDKDVVIAELVNVLEFVNLADKSLGFVSYQKQQELNKNALQAVQAALAKAKAVSNE